MLIKNITRLMPVLAFTAVLGSPAFADKPDLHDAFHKGKGDFEFALIGDTPYGVLPGAVYAPFDNLVMDINHNHKLKWVMHAGDIKSGSTECSDAMFDDRLKRYNKFKMPFVLTPGDNDWTDCHRVKAGEYQPLERLAKLREVFYNEPGKTIGGKPMRVESQASTPGYEEFPENVMWTYHNVIFSAIHVVGSQNGQAAFDPASSAVRTQADDEEVVRRTNAALAWMDAIFARASSRNHAGVFIMIQANPGLERGTANRKGFEQFLAALEKYAVAYGKPVVLAHGDSHYFRVDKPSMVSLGFIPNLTRVETFGSSKVHWVKVHVEPRSREVFSFQQQIVPENR